MKHKIPAAVILLFPPALLLFLLWKPDAVKTSAAAPAQRAQDAAVARALAANNAQATAMIAASFNAVRPLQNEALTTPTRNLAPAGRPAPLEFTNFSASIVLENMRHTIRNYGSRFGGNPVGTNPEITRALAGNNPQQVNFLNAEDGLRVNAQGELVDPWGTPFFFHQLSGSEMEIHSAGPDRNLWTADDLVVK